ncbi:hypothetical protein SAMN06295879_3213 [Agreia bicolorata]|uniref:Uncharacterized protein n=1 Tax=Agreia bicolorata TaxID=110935 RepID=A0A1T4YHT8_9MICO|nr:hypothetical protein [Agreia bicolorata]SKB01230.1 hypothetical protein SAMN06295879_3213 [Agreia bicolorata]
MEWWNNIADWFFSSNGRFVVSGIVLPAAAIIVAAIIGAWIASGSIKRLLAKHDRELKVAAIASLIDAAQQASVWNSLTPQEQIMSDRAVGQADIQIRLLPIKGSAVAADWAAHSLADMRRNSATFGYQVEPAVIEFRDRLIEWQERPGRSRKAFQSDLDRWSVEDEDAEKHLARQQEAWVAQQHHEQHSRPEVEATTVITPAAAPSPRESPTETPEQRAAREETQRVLENVNAVERHRESRDDSETPPPINAFPPRRASDND